MILFIKHVKEEGPGILEDYFSEKGYDIETIELGEGDFLPDKTDPIEAVISMGGPMNVYEEEKYPFLVQEDLFIKDVRNRSIPFLGVCLGAQLLAKAAGADITKNPVREIGFYEVTLSEEGQKDRIFNGIDSSFNVFQWHEDMFNIPVNGVRLAGNANCGNQAFKIGKNAYGLQFHVEADQRMILAWMKDHYKNKTSKYIIFEEETVQMLPEILRTGQLICQNFEQLI